MPTTDHDATMLAAVVLPDAPGFTLERIPVPRPRAGEALLERFRRTGVSVGAADARGRAV